MNEFFLFSFSRHVKKFARDGDFFKVKFEAEKFGATGN
jgi:hypothetical protein